jgi:hypothetical protein
MANPRNQRIEIIVILDTDNADETRCELESRWTVLQKASPRVLVLAGAPNTIPEVSAVKGVTALIDHELPKSLTSTLTPPEILFISAWLLRQNRASKQRRGDGLDWDTEGLLPPDPPKSKQQ